MPFIGEKLGRARERSNREDPFAVAIKRGPETVGCSTESYTVERNCHGCSVLLQGLSNKDHHLQEELSALYRISFSACV